LNTKKNHDSDNGNVGPGLGHVTMWLG